MRKFKIHFTTKDYDDFFIVEGETIEDVQEIAYAALKERGLDAKANNAWSEEIEHESND